MDERYYGMGKVKKYGEVKRKAEEKEKWRLEAHGVNLRLRSRQMNE